MKMALVCTISLLFLLKSFAANKLHVSAPIFLRIILYKYTSPLATRIILDTLMIFFFYIAQVFIHESVKYISLSVFEYVNKFN